MQKGSKKGGGASSSDSGQVVAYNPESLMALAVPDYRQLHATGELTLELPPFPLFGIPPLTEEGLTKLLQKKLGIEDIDTISERIDELCEDKKMNVATTKKKAFYAELLADYILEQFQMLGRIMDKDAIMHRLTQVLGEKLDIWQLQYNATHLLRDLAEEFSKEANLQSFSDVAVSEAFIGIQKNEMLEAFHLHPMFVERIEQLGNEERVALQRSYLSLVMRNVALKLHEKNLGQDSREKYAFLLAADQMQLEKFNWFNNFFEAGIRSTKGRQALYESTKQDFSEFLALVDEVGLYKVKGAGEFPKDCQDKLFDTKIDLQRLGYEPQCFVKPGIGGAKRDFTFQDMLVEIQFLEMQIDTNLQRIMILERIMNNPTSAQLARQAKTKLLELEAENKEHMRNQKRLHEVSEQIFSEFIQDYIIKPEQSMTSDAFERQYGAVNSKVEDLIAKDLYTAFMDTAYKVYRGAVKKATGAGVGLGVGMAAGGPLGAAFGAIGGLFVDDGFDLVKGKLQGVKNWYAGIDQVTADFSGPNFEITSEMIKAWGNDEEAARVVRNFYVKKLLELRLELDNFDSSLKKAPKKINDLSKLTNEELARYQLHERVYQLLQIYNYLYERYQKIRGDKSVRGLDNETRAEAFEHDVKVMFAMAKEKEKMVMSEYLISLRKLSALSKRQEAVPKEMYGTITYEQAPQSVKAILDDCHEEKVQEERRLAIEAKKEERLQAKGHKKLKSAQSDALVLVSQSALVSQEADETQRALVLFEESNQDRALQVPEGLGRLERVDELERTVMTVIEAEKRTHAFADEYKDLKSVLKFSKSTKAAKRGKALGDQAYKADVERYERTQDDPLNLNLQEAIQACDKGNFNLIKLWFNQNVWLKKQTQARANCSEIRAKIYQGSKLLYQDETGQPKGLGHVLVDMPGKNGLNLFELILKEADRNGVELCHFIDPTQKIEHNGEPLNFLEYAIKRGNHELAAAYLEALAKSKKTLSQQEREACFAFLKEDRDFQLLNAQITSWICPRAASTMSSFYRFAFRAGPDRDLTEHQVGCELLRWKLLHNGQYPLNTNELSRWLEINSRSIDEFKEFRPHEAQSFAKDIEERMLGEKVFKQVKVPSAFRDLAGEIGQEIIARGVEDTSTLQKLIACIFENKHEEFIKLAEENPEKLQEMVAGRNLAYLASELNCPEIAVFLRNKVKSESTQKDSAFTCAAANHEEHTFIALCESIIDEGSKASGFNRHYKDQSGLNPFHHLMYHGSPKAMFLLLETEVRNTLMRRNSYAFFNDESADGLHPLWYLAQRKDANEVLKALIMYVQNKDKHNVKSIFSQHTQTCIFDFKQLMKDTDPHPNVWLLMSDLCPDALSLLLEQAKIENLLNYNSLATIHKLIRGDQKTYPRREKAFVNALKDQIKEPNNEPVTADILTILTRVAIHNQDRSLMAYVQEKLQEMVTPYQTQGWIASKHFTHSVMEVFSFKEVIRSITADNKDMVKSFIVNLTQKTGSEKRYPVLNALDLQKIITNLISQEDKPHAIALAIAICDELVERKDLLPDSFIEKHIKHLEIPQVEAPLGQGDEFRQETKPPQLDEQDMAELDSGVLKEKVRVSGIANNCSFHCLTHVWLNHLKNLDTQQRQVFIEQNKDQYAHVLMVLNETYGLDFKDWDEVLAFDDTLHPFDREMVWGPVLRQVLIDCNEMYKIEKNTLLEYKQGKTVLEQHVAFLAHSLGAQHVMIKNMQDLATQPEPYNNEEVKNGFDLNIYYQGMHYDFTYGDSQLDDLHNAQFVDDELWVKGPSNKKQSLFWKYANEESQGKRVSLMKEELQLVRARQLSAQEAKQEADSSPNVGRRPAVTPMLRAASSTSAGASGANKDDGRSQKADKQEKKKGFNPNP